MLDSQAFIQPDWPAPPTVKAIVTTRLGGVSAPPFDGFNLALHVGDAAEAVLSNRARLQSVLNTPAAPQWLEQVHGVEVVQASAGAPAACGDAVITNSVGLPCAVLTADCLPVLLCDRQGAQVAAVHAGWRGLARGVIEATLKRFDRPAADILAWLGPAIGPKHFEVGEEVRTDFVAQQSSAIAAFQPSQRAGHWMADLYQLARLRLAAAGVKQVYGGDFCTFSDTQRFFSYRRAAVTGRMASLIWIESSKS